jgi:hypothetical protein
MVKMSTDREVALKATQATVVELEKETQSLVDRVDTATVALRTVIEARSTAERRVALSQSWARVKALDEEIADLDRRLTEMDKLVADRTEAQERLVGIKIDKRGFEHIQRLESGMREARAALGAIATRVRFLPSGNQEVRKNDEEIPLGETVELTEAARFTLEGFGGIDIEPGASDLASRDARFRESINALGEALAAAGVTDLAQARSHLEGRTEAETAMKEANRLMAAYAPEGVGALRATQREKSEERSRLNEERDLSLAADIGDPGTETRALASTRAGEEGARRALDTAEREHQQHVTQIAVARQAAKTIEEALATARRDLETARAGISDADLASRLETALGSLTQKKLSKEKTEEQLTAANPEEIKLRRHRAEATVHAVDAEQRRLRDSAIGLESRLAVLGKNGIGELLEEARGEAAEVVSRRDRLQTDAQAWDLLVGTLSSAERDAKEAFLEPVLNCIDPFLRLLLPCARLALDEETLEITGVTRDGREEPYAALSIGTREQLSILVRLAFAVYLRERGFPAAVILDDALVYADDDRFERMQLALRKAAETVQILILTCRPRDWRQFGAPIRRLADVRAVALEHA